MSDYQAAGIRVGHNLYTLRVVVVDLIGGFKRDANERRFISGSKDDIADAIDALTQMLGEIEAADTSQVVHKVPAKQYDRMTAAEAADTSQAQPGYDYPAGSLHRNSKKFPRPTLVDPSGMPQDESDEEQDV